MHCQMKTGKVHIAASLPTTGVEAGSAFDRRTSIYTCTVQLSRRRLAKSPASLRRKKIRRDCLSWWAFKKKIQRLCRLFCLSF